ncbi:MAG TPA: hypothetical protein ENI16_00515 [Candidatus Portnoybacteria bacterium]|nr:hypothetical protein [Candidatus Portnoybacteria bacterium]
MIHPYAYLVGSFIFLVVWLFLFLIRKDLRKEMLILSFIGGALFPLALIYLPDYWYPDHILGSYLLGIEDYIFAFAIAGIGAVAYEVVFGKTHTLCECRKQSPKRILSIAIVSIIILLSLTFIFKMNSIYSSFVAFLLIFAYIMYFRRDLFWQAILSGFLVAGLMLLFYQIWILMYPNIIQHWWKLENISGILILGVPLEEIIWGFNWGIVGGTIYEFARGVNSKNLRNIRRNK